MKRSIFTIALAALLALCLVLPTASLAEVYATVSMSTNGGSLFVRSGPGRDYKAVTTIHDGDDITVLKYGSVWSKIETESGKVGYIKNLYIDDGDSDYAAGTDYVSAYTAYTTGNVNLRSGASTDTKAIKTLSKGTKVSVRGKNGDFRLVQTSNGTQGYVSSKYLSKKKPSGSSSSGSGSSGSSSTVTKKINGAYVNVRAGGGTSYKVVAVLSRGTKVEVLKVGNYWVQIRCGSIKGWVKKQYLK